MTKPFDNTAIRGMLVIAVADILRREAGEKRELALASLFEYARGTIGEISYPHVYLTAKALNENPETQGVLSDEINVDALMAECERLLTEYFQEFQAQPTVQQLLRVIAMMGQTDEQLKHTKELSATDVFGVQMTQPSPDKE